MDQAMQHDEETDQDPGHTISPFSRYEYLLKQNKARFGPWLSW
jgi:hypothetical protein